MPDETTTIPPALSAEEWEFYGDKDDPFGERSESRSGYHDGLYSLAGVGLTPTRAHQTMAVANHILPDDHPGKFTREDLDNLRTELAVIEQEVGAGTQDYAVAESRLGPVIAKLAAILPPER